MKKLHFLTLIFLFPLFTLSAQSIERQLIGVAGGNNTDEQILLDWTLGETFTALYNSTFGIYKEGFLQPDNFNTDLNESNTETNHILSGQFSAKIFPNPFTETFTFQVSEVQEFDFHLLIVDYSGKVLMEKTLPAGSLKIDWAMNDYPSGLYFLECKDNYGKLVHSFKLLKL